MFSQACHPADDCGWSRARRKPSSSGAGPFPFEKTLGRRIDAVVGLDVLCKTSFSINYRTKRLRFGPMERTRSMVSFETGASFVTVEARLRDRTVRLLVDTGASALMLFQSRLNNPISTCLSAGWLANAMNVGGDFQRQAILIPDMHLGKENLGPQRGFVVADQRDDGRDFDGVLSVRGLTWKKSASTLKTTRSVGRNKPEADDKSYCSFGSLCGAAGIPTSSARACQCLGCGRCRPARMSAAKDSETPRVEAIAEIVTASSRCDDPPALRCARPGAHRPYHALF